MGSSHRKDGCGSTQQVAQGQNRDCPPPKPIAGKEEQQRTSYDASHKAQEHLLKEEAHKHPPSACAKASHNGKFHSSCIDHKPADYKSQYRHKDKKHREKQTGEGDISSKSSHGFHKRAVEYERRCAVGAKPVHP